MMDLRFSARLPHLGLGRFSLAGDMLAALVSLVALLIFILAVTMSVVRGKRDVQGGA